MSQLSIVHSLWSSQPGATFTHPVSGLQLSCVQSLLSSQLIVVNLQPVGATHVSLVHALLSLQMTGEWKHWPLTHVSLVHALLSLQLHGEATQPGQTPEPRVVPGGQEAQALVDVHKTQPPGQTSLHTQFPLWQ